MSRIKAFISYSSKQKVIGGKFKTFLENYCGYESFIAHEDIPGSTIWVDEIITAIKKSDFFIPLISEEFKLSPFTDQEIGIAVSLDKKIIPVKLDSTNPYGFIEKYQALQYKEFPPTYYFKDNIDTLVLTIGQIELFNPTSSHYNNALDSLVYAFCNSHSFNSTNATIQLLCKCPNLTTTHINLIKTAILTNSQINGGAYGLDSLKVCLRDKYKVLID